VGDVVHIASCSGNIFALDQTSGAKRWSLDANVDAGRTTFHGDPLVSGSMIVYPADTGVVYALESETGELLWKTRLPFSGVFNDAVAAGNLVVSANDKGGELVALDLETGAHRWTFVPPGERRGMNAAAPVIYGGDVLYGGPDGVVYAIGAESGMPSWSLDLAVSLETELALAGDLLAVGTGDRRLVLVDLTSRREVGDVDLPGVPDGTPVVAGTRVVLLALPDWLVSVDTGTGEIEWTAAGDWSSERPLVDGELLLAGTWSGEVVALDLDDGSVVWATEVEGGVRGLGKRGTTYFVGVSEGTIYAVRSGSGAASDGDDVVDR
jgi:outer membrane protein assembly factor BamB